MKEIIQVFCLQEPIKQYKIFKFIIRSSESTHKISIFIRYYSSLLISYKDKDKYKSISKRKRKKQSHSLIQKRVQIHSSHGKSVIKNLGKLFSHGHNL